MGEIFPAVLLAEMHAARAERDRLEAEMTKHTATMADIAKRAAAEGASNRAIAGELGISHTAVADMRAGRYGQGKPRGRPAG